ncbi:hypothetical protein CF335_g9279 [Tilletia laevis]|nr:hypothetical protein CF335_g9279 [Tilletia laevis]
MQQLPSDLSPSLHHLLALPASSPPPPFAAGFHLHAFSTLVLCVLLILFRRGRLIGPFGNDAHKWSILGFGTCGGKGRGSLVGRGVATDQRAFCHGWGDTVILFNRGS